MTLEQKFDSFITSLRHAEKIDGLPNASFSGEKADYLIYERGMILEVKFLTEDRGRTISEKLSELADTDPDFPQFFGTVHVEEIIRRHRNSDAFRNWICNFAARTLDSLIRKADSQIAATQRALSLERSTGILVLLNEGIQLYDDDFIRQEVSRLLNRRRGDRLERPHVEAVWFINEYLTAQTNQGSSFAFIGPSARNDNLENFFNMLHVSWCARNGYAIRRSASSSR